MDTESRRARRRERWQQRAERASDAFGLVFTLVLVTYALSALVSFSGWTAVLIATSSCATSVVALISANALRRLIHAAVVLALLAVVLAAVGAISEGRAWYSAGSLIEVVLLTVAMLAVLRRVVLGADEVGARTILGALSVYAVLGLLFTFLYSAVDRLQGGAFFEGVAHPAGSDYLFFSYTTLTTTGFGDLVPGGQPGRMITGIEMMIGQVFLVTLVAGLVSLWKPGEAMRRRRERRAGESAG